MRSQTRLFVVERKKRRKIMFKPSSSESVTEVKALNVANALDGLGDEEIVVRLAPTIMFPTRRPTDSLT